LLYLNTALRAGTAEKLAGQLARVLNECLPARLNEISDKPGGLSLTHSIQIRFDRNNQHFRRESCNYGQTSRQRQDGASVSL